MYLYIKSVRYDYISHHMRLLRHGDTGVTAGGHHYYSIASLYTRRRTLSLGRVVLLVVFFFVTCCCPLGVFSKSSTALMMQQQQQAVQAVNKPFSMVTSNNTVSSVQSNDRSNGIDVILPTATFDDESAAVAAVVDDEQQQQQHPVPVPVRLEELKQREAELAALLTAVRREKLAAIRSKPLTIGIVGFGRFGQFIGKTFSKYGKVIGTSRSDYTDIAKEMGATYIPLSDPEAFLAQNVDVIVFAVSIMSFESTIRDFVPHLEKDLERRRRMASSSSGSNGQQVVHGPLIVDVLSVKEHARSVLLDLLPVECDILTTHPMFGPDSGKNGWTNLNFVYERTRINQVVLDPERTTSRQQRPTDDDNPSDCFVDATGCKHSVHEDSEAHIEAVDRIERFLSIWEEEGCRMVPMSCREHDSYTADSQFITHLMGRILGSQGLSPTPIDTNGFQSVLRLVDTTTADSFDLFYGLYKFNQNSMETISKLRVAMDDVVGKLQAMEEQEEGQAKTTVS